MSNFVNAFQTNSTDPTMVTAVSPATPLPTAGIATMATADRTALNNADQSYRTSAAYTPSDTVSGGTSRALAIVSTVAGNVSVLMSGGGTFVFPVAVGLTIIPVSIVRVNVTGTTATATCTNLT